MSYKYSNNVIKKLMFIIFVIGSLHFLLLFSFAAINVTGAGVTPNTDTKTRVAWESVTSDIYDLYPIEYSLYRAKIQSISSTDTPAVTGETVWTTLTTFTDRDGNVDRNNMFYLDGVTTPLESAQVYAYKVTLTYTDAMDVVVVDSGIVFVSTAKPIQAVVSNYVYDLNKNTLNIELDSLSRSAAKVEVLDSVLGRIFQGNCVPTEEAAKKIIVTNLAFKAGRARIITIKHYDSNGVASDATTAFSIDAFDIPTLFSSVVDGSANIYGSENLPWNYFIFQRSYFASDVWSEWETITPTQISKGVYQDKIAAGATAKYRLKSKEGEHYSGYSYTTSTLVNTTAITELTSSFIEGPKIKITWKNGGVSKQYIRVERRIDNGYYQVVGDIDNTSLYFIDSATIEPNKKYYYRISEYEVGTPSIVGPETFISSVAPTLTLRIIDTTSIKLEWDKSYTDENGVDIMRKMDNGGYTVLNSQNTQGSYVDSTILKGHTYSYYIKLNSYSDYWNVNSNEVSVFYQEKLIEISSFEALPESNTSIRLNWRYSNFGASYAYIERKTSDDISWALTAKVNGDINTYLDLNLKENTKYFYRVSVVLENNIFSAVFPADESVYSYTLPSNPTGLIAYSGDDGSITLTWNSQQYVEGFVIYRKSTKETDFSENMRVEKDINTWQDTDVEKQYGYIYKITALSGTVESKPSNTAQILALEKPFSKIEYYMNSASLVFSWTLATDFVKPVKIEKLDSDSETWKTLVSVNDSKNSYSDNSVKAGESYTYRLSVVNKKTNKTSKSDDIPVTTLLIEKPLNLRAVATSAKVVTLSWINGSVKKYTYVVYRKKGEEFIEIGRTTSSVTIYEDKGLTGNTQYSYFVRAYGSDIFSAASNEVSVLTSPSKTIMVSSSYTWAKPSISALNDKGAIAPQMVVAGRFKPEKIITRAEFLSILIRYIDGRKLLPGTFKDTNENDWYYYDIVSAKNSNIIKGVGDGKFNPSGEITRQDIAVVIANALKSMKKPIRTYSPAVLKQFSDYEKVGSYAVPAIAFMVSEGMIKGSTDGKLNPTSPATRAEAAIMIYNTLRILE